MLRKDYDYNNLVEGLQKEPTFEIAEAIAKKDFPLKLPDRKFLTVYNSAEVSQFRGIQEEMDDTAKQRNKTEADKVAINRAAADANISTPDMTFVNEAVNRQRQMASSYENHMNDLARLHAQQMATQSHENRTELERLANRQADADRKARMAEMALSGLRDVQEEDRARLARMAASQGVVHNHIDARTVNNNTHLDNQSQHNQVLQLVNNHGHAFAEFMNQQNLNQSQLMNMLQEHVRRNTAPVIHMMPQGGSDDSGPMELEAYSAGLPPGPPPSSGAVSRLTKKGPAFNKKRDPRAIIVNRAGDPPPPPPPGVAGVPLVIPTVPTQAAAVAQTFDIGTPRTSRRPRSRSVKAKARSIPWTTGMMQPEAAIPDSEDLPVPMIIAEGRGRARARNSSSETVRYPSGEPAQVKARAKSKSREPSVAASMRQASLETIRLPSEQPAVTRERTRSGQRVVSNTAAAAVRAASGATVRYPSEARSEVNTGISQGSQPPPPPAPGRAKAKAKSRASIFREPSRDSSASGAFLPTEENATKTGIELAKVKKKILKKPSTLLAEIRAVELANEIASGRTTLKPSGKDAKPKVVIRKVRIASGPAKVMGGVRGRPKGAVGKAKRDLLGREGSAMVA
jgi:hypothetical protein